MNSETLKPIDISTGKELTKEQQQQRIKEIIERYPGANYDGLVCTDGQKADKDKGCPLIAQEAYKQPLDYSWIVPLLSVLSVVLIIGLLIAILVRLKGPAVKARKK